MYVISITIELEKLHKVVLCRPSREVFRGFRMDKEKRLDFLIQTESQ